MGLKLGMPLVTGIHFITAHIHLMQYIRATMEIGLMGRFGRNMVPIG